MTIAVALSSIRAFAIERIGGPDVAKSTRSTTGDGICAGRSGKQVQLERARTEVAVASYDNVVLNAFREVEDGLVALQQLQIEVGAAVRQVAAARRAVALAGDRYQGGVDSYTTLLDAQRVLADAELVESGLQRQQRVAVVQLYRALGGGWDPVTDSLAIPHPAR